MAKSPESLKSRGKLRGSDLARAGGMSVQQVRNYVDLGVLPPVSRTEAGYRIFTAEHAEALVVARRLAEAHGPDRMRAIMRAVHKGQIDVALAELDRSHAELDRERGTIERVLSAFEIVVVEPELKRRTVRIGEVADAVGVRTSALRLWEQAGLLRPTRERSTGYRLYDRSELRNAQVVALLRRGNYPLAIVRAVVDEIRATGSPERVRAELAKREQQLYQRSLLRLRASAALYGYLQSRDVLRQMT